MTPEELLARQTLLRNGIRDKLLVQALAAWDGLGSWRDADVDRLLARVVPLVQAGQITTAASTNAYLSQLIGTLSSGATTAAGIPREDVVNVRPVPPEEVYRRPFTQTWTALGSGTAFPDALRAGRDRLTRLISDDLDLAHRNAARTVFSGSTYVDRYRRVIRPELSKSGNCDLCAKASENRYRSAELMPIHSRCACDVMPIVGRVDPARAMNSADLRGTTITERTAVRQHGELGPVLTRATDAFTGADDLAA